MPDESAPKPVMDVHDVGMVYGEGKRAVTALDGISFAVKEGEFASLVGPSGCGKSTLLQIVGGLLRRTSGTALVDGAPVTGPMPGKIAFVFQEAMLMPWKTALSNIEFPLEIQGLGKEERRDRAREMLSLVGLAEFAEHFPHQLSGGMKQRVSLARGLAQRPRIILMDEPFGALDEQTRIKMGRELLRVWDRTRTTVLFVTHSLTEALYLSDRVIVMGRRPGRIVETIDVGLPRPRKVEMMGAESFGRARNRLWALLDQDGENASGGLPVEL